MSKLTMIAGIALLAGTIGPAIAGHGHAARTRSERPAISTDAMRQKIDALGYDVRRLRRHGAMFRTTIVDRQSGGVVRARFDRSGELLRASPAS